MAARVLKNCKLYLAGHNLSGDVNKMTLDYSAEMLEATTFADESKRRVAGLFDISADHEGYYQAGSTPDLVDKILWDKLGLADQVMTICPTTGVAGEIAYTTKTVEAEYSPNGAVGELFAFSVSAQGTERLVRATVMQNGTITATGNGTARQLGAVTADQKIYAAVHLVSVSGTNPTLDIDIESDDAEAFSTGIDRITFDQMTAIGAQWKELAGAITDDWWRPVFTIGGIDPSFTVVVLLGIM